MSPLFLSKSTYLDLVNINTQPYRREINFNQLQPGVTYLYPLNTRKHIAQKNSFPLRIYSVNVTKSAGNC